MNEDNYNAANLRYALNVVINTRASTIDLLTTYVSTNFNETEEELAQRYRLHNLTLDYPLKEAVNSSEYDGQITKSLVNEVLDIYYSLAKIGKVLSNVTDNLAAEPRNNYFQYIVEKVEHNIANALAFVNCTTDVEDNIPDPFHRHPCREYGIVSEFVKLLHVLEKKYEVMLMQQEQLEEA